MDAQLEQQEISPRDGVTQGENRDNFQSRGFHIWIARKTQDSTNLCQFIPKALNQLSGVGL